MKRSLVFWAGLSLSGATFPASLPEPVAFDRHMRTVVYNPDDVVRIQGAYGISTNITFAPDETIESTALGDTLAWTIAPTGNHLFLKPTEPNAHTNMSVITSKRTYEFDLVAVDKDRVPVFYRVKYAYPTEEAAARRASEEHARDEVAAARAAQERTRHAEDQVEKVGNALHDAEVPVRRGVNYWLRGSAVVQPDEAFDDGQFTYFRFRGNREFPVVYLQDAHGNESLVNVTVKGDTLVAQRIAEKFVLRKGADVAQVVNPNYDPVGIATGTGTISAAVERTVRNEHDPLPESLPTQPLVDTAARPLADPATDLRPARTISPESGTIDPATALPPTPGLAPLTDGPAPSATSGRFNPLAEGKPSAEEDADTTADPDDGDEIITWVRFARGARLRAGPSPESDVVGFLPPNTTVPVAGDVPANAWLRVNGLGKGAPVAGYVARWLGRPIQVSGAAPARREQGVPQPPHRDRTPAAGAVVHRDLDLNTDVTPSPGEADTSLPSAIPAPARPPSSVSPESRHAPDSPIPVAGSEGRNDRQNPSLHYGFASGDQDP